MKRYVIERQVPGVGASNDLELCNISRTSNAALNKLLGEVQWEHSYVTGDKTFCIYLADNENAVRRHAELSGFPANIITEVKAIIDPITANAKAA